MFIPLFQLQLATERLQKINESIDEKSSAREDYDKTIRETEAAYMKVTCRLFNSLHESYHMVTYHLFNSLHESYHI